MIAAEQQHAEKMTAMAEAVLRAVEAAEQALTAVDEALVTSQALAVPAFGFPDLMAVRGPLGRLINPHGPAIALSRNEIKAVENR